MRSDDLRHLMPVPACCVETGGSCGSTRQGRTSRQSCTCQILAVLGTCTSPDRMLTTHVTTDNTPSCQRTANSGFCLLELCYLNGQDIKMIMMLNPAACAVLCAWMCSHQQNSNSQWCANETADIAASVLGASLCLCTIMTRKRGGFFGGGGGGGEHQLPALALSRGHMMPPLRMAPTIMDQGIRCGHSMPAAPTLV